MTGRHAVAQRAPRRVLAVALLLALATAVAVVVVGSCSNGTAAGAAGSVEALPTASARSTPVPPVADADRVLAGVAAAAAGAGGRITTVVLDADGTPLVTGPHADTPAYTASLAKLFVVARLLDQDSSGALRLTGDDLALMQAALVTSDDDAMSTLWVRYDGARLVTDVVGRLGLTRTGPPTEPGQWGQAMTSARDVAVFLVSIRDLLDDADADTMLGWLRSTTPTAADGFGQRFGLLSGVAGSVAAKQGWMCCVDGGRQLHSVGVLADGRVVVLLGEFPGPTPWGQASAALDAAAAAVLAGIG